MRIRVAWPMTSSRKRLKINKMEVNLGTPDNSRKLRHRRRRSTDQTFSMDEHSVGTRMPLVYSHKNIISHVKLLVHTCQTQGYSDSSLYVAMIVGANKYG